MSDHEAKTVAIDLLSALKALSHVSRQCVHHAEHLEADLEQWLENGGMAEDFPTVAVQRIDLIQQMQADIARLLVSDAVLAAATREGEHLDLSDFLQSATLGYIRQELRSALPGGLSGQDPTPVKTFTAGSLDLF